VEVNVIRKHSEMEKKRTVRKEWGDCNIKDIKWYTKTCHECQVQQMCKLHIPPTIPIPGGLFWKVHIDTMKMPKASGFEYLVQACCTLTLYPE
jgi:hypothetical protein